MPGESGQCNLRATVPPRECVSGASSLAAGMAVDV
jgi:hypothetical protein